MDKIIKEAVERFSELVDSLECECDSYNGFTCNIHADRILAANALKEIKNDNES